MPPPSEDYRRSRPGRRAAPALVLAAVVALVWGHTVGHEFVWDDYPFIVRLESIRSLGNVGRMFHDLRAQADTNRRFDALPFRPLRNVHFALLVAATGTGRPEAWAFHLANVLWHAAVGGLLYAVARRLLALWRDGGSAPPAGTPAQPDALALLVAVSFVAHPVVSEVVCWAKALDDLMAAAFVLGAVLLLLRPNAVRRRGPYLGALGLYAAAVYAKESAVPLLLVAFLLFRRPHGLRPVAAAVHALPFAAVAAIYAAHRHAVLGRTSQIAPISGSYGQTLFDMTAAAVHYARLALGIPPFCIDYAFLQGGLTLADPVAWAGIALLIALAVACFAGGRRAQGQGVRFGACWFAAFMLPVSNLVPMMQYMAERFLYLPLMGVLLVAASVAQRAARRRLCLVLWSVVALGWAASARQRSMVWRDPLTLFVSAWHEGAGSWRVEANLVDLGLDQPHVRRFLRAEVPPAEVGAQWPRVEATLAQLNSLYPTNVVLLNANGVAQFVRGRPAEALEWFRRAEASDATVPESYRNQALALAALGRTEEAVRAMRRFAALRPSDATADAFLRTHEAPAPAAPLPTP